MNADARDGVTGDEGPFSAWRYVPRGEQIRIRLKPHPTYILLGILGRLSLLVLATASLWWLATVWPTASGAWMVGLLAVLLLMAWSLLNWVSRTYLMTDRRLIRVAGVFRQYITDIPLERVRHFEIARSFRERLLNLGTLGFSTAGTGAIEMAWVGVGAPEDVLNRVRTACETGRSDGRRPIAVIGIAGAIGSGKSAFAAALAAHGCLVSDSDQQARAALDLPEVREQLVGWWGRDILTPEGRVNRSAVSEIVFRDAQERQRLESLVHPIVRRSRSELISEARQTGATAVVVDAPLLFEVGLDKGCDAVIYVHCDEARRLARVRESRGWGPEELSRREKAQLPLDEKRRRSDYEVINDGSLDALEHQAGRVLAEIRQTLTPENDNGR